DETGHRRQIDDRAAVYAALAGFAQSRRSQFRAEKDAGQIDTAEPVPIGKARVFEARPEKHAGVVDEDVEAAEPTGCGRDCPLPILLPGDVEMREDRGGAGS